MLLIAVEGVIAGAPHSRIEFSRLAVVNAGDREARL
jgi:hypothetical protein